MSRLLALSCLIVASSSVRSARAASYVDTPALGRATFGVQAHVGSPLGSSAGAADVDARASVIGGGGSELLFGYAWDSGWALSGVFGAARWSSRGPLAQTLRDRDASIVEGYGGLALRFVPNDADAAPFVSLLALFDVMRVRGAREGEAVGLAGGAQLGFRMRDATTTSGWEWWAAVDVRHARLSAPYDEADRVVTTRLALAIGAAWDGGLR